MNYESICKSDTRFKAVTGGHPNPVRFNAQSHYMQHVHNTKYLALQPWHGAVVREVGFKLTTSVAT